MSKKTVFKVAELPHIFFNATRDNATAAHGFRAGEHASVRGAVLIHGGRAAAARIVDATAPDGAPVYVIAPQYADSDARWSPNTLRAAVPENDKPGRVVALARWPQAGNLAFTPSEDGTWREGRVRIDSAAALFACYMAAFNAAGMASVRSEIDPQGDEPGAPMAAYAEAVRNILALTWNNAIAQHDARKAWAAMLDFWGANSQGETDATIVRAIATREHLAAKAAAALPMLRDYFTQRAAVRHLSDLVNLRRRFRAHELSGAVAAVLRAGVPAVDAALLGSNPAGAIVADAEKVKRLERWEGARDYLARVQSEGGRQWRDYWRAITAPAANLASIRPPGWTDRDNGATPSQIAAMRYVNARNNDCDARAVRLRQHHAAVAYAAAFNDSLAVALPVLERIENDESRAAFLVPDNATAVDGALSAVRELKAAALNAARYAGKNPALIRTAETARTWGLATLKGFERCDAAISHMLDFERRNQGEIKARRYLADIAEQRAKAETTPRAVRYYMEGCRYHYVGVYGVTPEQSAAIESAYRDALAYCDARKAEVSPMDEFRAGGNAPGPFDWCRVKGAIVETTRGARVALRDVRRAFRLLDSLPAGAVNLENRRFMLGTFQLMRREECGAVVVGCHRFSAEAVAMLRADAGIGEPGAEMIEKTAAV